MIALLSYYQSESSGFIFQYLWISGPMMQSNSKKLVSFACNNQTVYFWSAVFTMVAQQPKNQGAAIGRKFEALEKQLKTKTQDPEEVDFLKQRMLTMPITINELRGEIDQTEVSPPVWVWPYNFFLCSILYFFWEMRMVVPAKSRHPCLI